MRLTGYEMHQKRLAEAVLNVPDAIITGIGGMTKEEAQKVLDRLKEREEMEEFDKKYIKKEKR